MPQGCISGMVALARQVHNVKTPWKGPLLESEQARVSNLIQGTIAQDLHQRFMVGNYDAVVASLREVSRLFQSPGYSQGLPFNSRIVLLCWR